MSALTVRLTDLRLRLDWWSRFAVLLGLFFTLGPTFTSGQQDTLLLDAIVRIEIDGGPAEVVPALSQDTSVLIPLSRFLFLSEIPLEDFTYGESVDIRIEPGNIPLRFAPDEGIFTRGDSVFQLGRFDAVWRADDLYISLSTLDRAFDVGSTMSWADLSVLVARSRSLPVVRRTRRERRRARLARPDESLPAQLILQRPSSIADGAVLQWSINAPTNAPVDNMAMDLGAGTKLLDGSLELRYQRNNSPNGATSNMRGSWSRAWTNSSVVRQVRLGDVVSNGLRARSVQGVVITNAPFIRASEFDVDAVLGNLPVGWEVELYERGRLRAWHEVDTRERYQMPLQLRYGQNAFQLVLYGPGGEVIRETRTIRVPFSRLPAGKFEYGIAGGRCRGRDCQGLLSTDVRYGVSSRITVQAGSDYFWREALPGLWQPYAVVSASLLPSLNITGEGVLNSRARGAVALEPSPNFRLDVGHTLFDPNGTISGRTLNERNRTEGALTWRPGGSRSVYVRLDGMHSTGPDIKRTLQRVTLSSYLWRIRLQSSVRYDVSERAGVPTMDRSGIDFTARTTLNGPASWLRATNIRAAVGIDRNEGLAALRAGIGRQIAKKVRFDIDVGWFQDGGYTIDVGFNTLLPGPRFGARNHTSSEGTNSGLMYVDGSMIVDPDSRVLHFSDGRDLGRAGIAGSVFFDENANGVKDEGEGGLEGIPVHVGGWFDQTDENGRFKAWDLFPFQQSTITVDSLAFDDPRLVPTATRISVTPTPNSFQSIDIPVVVGAEISGYVVFEDAVLGGVPILLHDLASDRVFQLETFSNGVFYRIAVPPGEYEIRIPRQTLQRLDATANPVHISVPSGPGDKRIEDLVITVERLSDEPGILDRYSKRRVQRRDEESERRR